MENGVSGKEQFDWTEKNFRPISSLRTTLAHQFRKDGLTPSRAMIAASDQIASELMIPAKTGQDLDRWIAQQLADIRRTRQNGHNGNGYTRNGNGNGHGNNAADLLSADAVEFSVPEGLTPPVVADKAVGTKWVAVKAVLRDAKIGEWTPLLFKNQADARSASGVLGYHSKNALQCANYGWKFKSRVDRGNPLLLWFIKEKK